MDEQGNSVLIVDDEAINIAALAHILNPFYTVFVSKDGHSAVNTALQLKPDVILLDVLMPGISGFDIIVELKNLEETMDIPVIFVTGLTNHDDEERGLNLGAADYIHKPYNPAVVKLRVQNQIQIVNQMKMIQHLSMTDPLTGTANRRHFNDRLDQEWYRAVREGNNIGLMLLDVDDFKCINDTYGHLFGDAVLQNIAHNIQLCLKRPMDLASRWGGEEFAVLLPNTSLEGAAVVAEQIRAAVALREYPAKELKGVPVTVSIGINSNFPDSNASLYDFINSVDKALYLAKQLGKNRVCAYH